MGLLEDVDLICSGSASMKERQDAGARKTKASKSTELTMEKRAPHKKASTSASSKAKSTSAARHNDTNASDGARSIEAMSIGEMQAEVTKYGFRPSKQKAALQQQLREVRSAMTASLQDQAALADTSIDALDDLSAILSSSPSSSALMHRPTQSQPTARAARQAILLSSDDEGGKEAEMGDLSLALLEEERNAKRATQQRAADSAQGRGDSGESSSSEDDDGGDDEAEEREVFSDDEEGAAVAASGLVTDGGALGTVPAHVARQLLTAVMSDEDLYQRILRFEPISFDEFSSLANRANIQGMRNKETLRNWLDCQCVCFFTAELSGSRTRY